jgi:hypothetical protein
MAQQFTRNYTDHSNDTGYQFEFKCDKCGNGYRSSFRANKLGMAAGLLKVAGNLFGGALSRAGYGADGLKDALRGSAWDDAFKEAIDEIKPKFHQCSRCGKWVCPEICWNAARGLCEECAPDLQEAAASIQARVAVEQINEKAKNFDQTGGLDLSVPQHAAAAGGHATSCPSCKATVPAGTKFCGECGAKIPAPAAAAKTFCGECGAKIQPGVKFCPECGKSTVS